MYEIRQIIFRLRQDDSIRGISRAKLADRKKVRKIHRVAVKQGWLDLRGPLPSEDELLKSFKPKPVLNQSSSIAPFKIQIEEWYKQGIQASTIHAALQRQHNFSGGLMQYRDT